MGEYSQPPSPQRLTRIEQLTRFRDTCHLYLQTHDGRIERWTGLSSKDGSILSVVYLGNRSAVEKRHHDYLFSLLFIDGQAAREQAGDCAPRDFSARAAELASKADLLIIDQNRRARFQPPRGEWLRARISARMVFELHPGEDWEAVQKRFKSQSRNLRRMRRYGLQPRITNSPEDFEFFYDRMYLPLIQSRHSSYVKIDSKETMKGYFQHGFLLQVLSADGEPVAADLLMPDQAMLFNVGGGVKDADPEWFQRGVLSAAYYFQIQWAHQNGFHYLDAGPAHPLVNNGIFNHKLLWGMQPVDDWRESNDWTFWVPDGSQAAFRWLAENRFDSRFVSLHGDTIQRLYRPDAGEGQGQSVASPTIGATAG